MLASSLRRGLAAGLVAGLLAGMFALVVGSAPMAEAIGLEEQAHHVDDPAAADHDHHDRDHDEGEHLVGRTTQRTMLPVATGLLGTALGGLFGLLFAGLRGSLREPSPWRASLKLGAVGWATTVLAPTLTSPANPPGVGDPTAVGERTFGYGSAVVIAVVLALAAWGLAEALRRRTGLPAPTRQLVTGSAVTLAALALLAVLPSELPGSDVPAELLWSFRLAAVGTLTILSVGTAVGFGWAAQRGERRVRREVA